MIKRKAAPGGLFETSLKKCLQEHGFSQEQIKAVTEKPQAAEGKGKGQARKGGKGGKGGRGAGGRARHRCFDARWYEARW